MARDSSSDFFSGHISAQLTIYCFSYERQNLGSHIRPQGLPPPASDYASEFRGHRAEWLETDVLLNAVTDGALSRETAC